MPYKPLKALAKTLLLLTARAWALAMTLAKALARALARALAKALAKTLLLLRARAWALAMPSGLHVSISLMQKKSLSFLEM